MSAAHALKPRFTLTPRPFRALRELGYEDDELGDDVTSAVLENLESLARTDEMPSLSFATRATSVARVESAGLAGVAGARPEDAEAAETVASQAAPSQAAVSEVVRSGVRARGARETDSDVFLVRRKSREMPALSPELVAAAQDATVSVTLFVYGWDNVQPGPLSWVFPSFRAALNAVKAMRNAIGWAIATGTEDSIDDAREKGAVLIEQNT